LKRMSQNIAAKKWCQPSETDRPIIFSLPNTCFPKIVCP
jgi:hypothetical protein